MWACIQGNSNIRIKKTDLESFNGLSTEVLATRIGDSLRHRRIWKRASVKAICRRLLDIKVTWLFQTVSCFVFCSLSLIHKGQGSGVYNKLVSTNVRCNSSVKCNVWLCYKYVAITFTIDRYALSDTKYVSVMTSERVFWRKEGCSEVFLVEWSGLSQKWNTAPR